MTKNDEFRCVSTLVWGNVIKYNNFSYDFHYWSNFLVESIFLGNKCLIWTDDKRYVCFCANEGEQNLGNRRNGVVNEEVGLINLQLKLRRLVRGTFWFMSFFLFFNHQSWVTMLLFSSFSYFFLSFMICITIFDLGLYSFCNVPNFLGRLLLLIVAYLGIHQPIPQFS